MPNTLLARLSNKILNCSTNSILFSSQYLFNSSYTSFEVHTCNLSEAFILVLYTSSTSLTCIPSCAVQRLSIIFFIVLNFIMVHHQPRRNKGKGGTE